MFTIPLDRQQIDLPQTDLRLAQTVGHLETCDFCLEQEALTFAELLDYSRADVPGIDYFMNYYSVDRISAARVESIRERILALCAPVRVCCGCSKPIENGTYCAGCAEEVASLIAGPPFELSKRLWAALGFALVALLVYFDLTAILATWP